MTAGGPSARRDEIERQCAAIMRGTAFGDETTRRTMEQDLRARLAESLRDQRPLRVYLGVDPTAPDLHLGHCLALRKLRTFQDLGHQAILLIGDFTGLVGDPSDKDALRPMQSRETLEENARSYQEQAFKILDPARTEVRRNSDWLAALRFEDVIQLAAKFTVAQFIERDTVRRRLERGEPVYVHEFMYGLMQAYDAHTLKADVQLGGTEQTFNIMAGRTLQRSYGEPPQIAITLPILVGLDGKQRMSKSTGNYIGIAEPPDDQYGKAMSIPDSLLNEYFTLATNLAADEVSTIERALADGSLPPMEAKQRLAHAIVSEWHDAAAAAAAADRFARVFSQRQTPDDMPEHAVRFDGARASLPLAPLLLEAGLVASRSEVKRLLGQGAIQLNGERVEQGEISVAPGAVLRVGKRRWLRIVAE